MGLNEEGLLIVISGPSGVGKDTIINKLINKHHKLKLSVSSTTRTPRQGEVHGKDYYFIREEKFLEMVSNSEFLEYAKYCGNFYGTPISNVSEMLSEGNDVILEIEVQGGAQIKKRCPDAVSIFIYPPSIKSLENRITGRGLDSEEVIKGRINESKKELMAANEYDYIVVNDSITICVDNIIKIIQSEHMKAKRMKYIIDEVLKNE